MTTKTSPFEACTNVHYRGDPPEMVVTPLELGSSVIYFGNAHTSPVRIFCSTPFERLRAACEAFNAELNERAISTGEQE